MKSRGKTFLNSSFNEKGHIRWEVLSGTDKRYHAEFLSGELVIADCSSSICLDFDCEKRSHIDKRIAKLDTLIDELGKMREALEAAKKPPKFHY